MNISARPRKQDGWLDGQLANSSRVPASSSPDTVAQAELHGTCWCLAGGAVSVAAGWCPHPTGVWEEQRQAREWTGRWAPTLKCFC